MFNLEQSIQEWRQQMLAAGIKSNSLDELEGHLCEEIEKQVKAGTSAQQALEIAAQQIGHAKVLKEEFRKTETVLQTIKNSADLVFIVLMTIVVALTFCFALEWQPVAIMISHDGSPSHPILYQMRGKLWGEETGMMRSICIIELLLLSFALPLAAAFHIRRNPGNLKRLKRTTRIGQWCTALWGLKIISSDYPFWGLVMALMTCVIFVIALRWQVRSSTISQSA